MNPEVALAATYYHLYRHDETSAVDLVMKPCASTTTTTTAPATTSTPKRLTEEHDRKKNEEEDKNNEETGGNEFFVWQEDEWTSEDERVARTFLEQQQSFVAGRSQTGNLNTDSKPEKSRRDLSSSSSSSSSSSIVWDRFYRVHQAKFFKDRHYLATEFPLEFGSLPQNQSQESNNKDVGRGNASASSSSSNTTAKRCLVEIGCGVGNALLPLLYDSDWEHGDETNDDQQRLPRLQQKQDSWTVYGLDVSSVAIDLLRREPRFVRAAQQGRAHAYCCDIARRECLPVDCLGVASVATLLFCLSAIDPTHHAVVARNVMETLAPGGVLVVRDYGRYDQAQLQLAQRQQRQFSGFHYSNNNFYRKHDGTCCYYFTTEDLERLFGSSGVGMQVLELKYIRRAYHNRSTKEIRRRVWVQARFQKQE